jgi:amino acid permease
MRNSFWVFITIILILVLIIRFASFILVAAVKFWFITIPVILIIMFRSSSRKVDKSKSDTIEDAEFEVLDDEEEGK